MPGYDPHACQFLLIFVEPTTETALLGPKDHLHKQLPSGADRDSVPSRCIRSRLSFPGSPTIAAVGSLGITLVWVEVEADMMGAFLTGLVACGRRVAP